MNSNKVPITWRLTLILSLIVLVLVTILNFYGLYSNKFYFHKVDNYIIPLLVVIHFSYLYQVWHKIKTKEFSSRQMRNLEYSLYFILLVYLFKFFDTFYIIMTYADYEASLFPKTFFPASFLVLFLYTLLFGLTLKTFVYRRKLVGRYHFDEMNQHVDHWN